MSTAPNRRGRPVSSAGSPLLRALVELLRDLSGLADLLHDHEAIVIGDDSN